MGPTRLFGHAIDGQAAGAVVPESSSDDAPRVMRLIRDDVVGAMAAFDGPFGQRRVVYADWTASGRALRSVEQHILDEVLPWYGNTHTTTSVTGLQSTWYRQEARQLAHHLCGGTEDDVVLFTGTGATAALGKLAGVLTGTARAKGGATVLVGPFEHHSNLLPWRESELFEVVVVPESTSGQIDVEQLRTVLQDERKARGPDWLIVGCFSAASNVTGVLTDTDLVSDILHSHGAIACWDYAAAAPYVNISMRGKDAVCFSPHKFPGGPGAPGVLVLKRSLLAGAVPTTPGGGTVFFVSDKGHRYLANLEEREEGGTPDIVGAARCAAALRVKERVGTAAITARERELSERLGAALRGHPSIKLLGPLGAGDDAQCLPVLSFLVAAPPSCGGRFLHYNFVCALLNDLFGIQTRGGCMCAGPYGISLLGIKDPDAFERALLDDRECLRPGFTRVSVVYAQSDAEIDFIGQAIRWVASNGWLLLPSYRWYHDTGEWRHRADTVSKRRRWLTDSRIAEAGCEDALIGSARRPKHLDAGRKQPAEAPPEGGDYFAWCFDRATAASEAAARPTQSAPEELSACAGLLGDVGSRLRWFALPSEAVAEQQADSQQTAFSPRSLPVRLKPVGGSGPAAVSAEAPTAADGAGRLTLHELRAELQRRGLQTTGVRQALERRLEVALSGAAPEAAQAAAPAAAAADAPFASLATALSAGNATNADWAAAQRAEPPEATARAAPDVAEPDVAELAPAAEGAEGAEAEAATPRKRKRPPLPKVPPKLMRLMGKANRDYAMLRQGDRVLVGLSGGKDSLTLLHALIALSQKSPVKFEVGACTVDPLAAGYNPGPALVPYLQSIGVPYFLEQQPIVEQAKEHMDAQRPSICAWCSRMKRGILYTTARREGYNVLALGQHLDDLLESFLMSAFHNGMLRTQKAHYENDAGDIRIIRPLCFVRERDCAAFAAKAKLPVVAENCPACFQAPQERARVKAVLAQQEALFPQLPYQMLTAMRPLMVGALEPRNSRRGLLPGQEGAEAAGQPRESAEEDDCIGGMCGIPAAASAQCAPCAPCGACDD